MQHQNESLLFGITLMEKTILCAGRVRWDEQSTLMGSVQSSLYMKTRSTIIVYEHSKQHAEMTEGTSEKAVKEVASRQLLLLLANSTVHHQQVERLRREEVPQA